MKRKIISTIACISVLVLMLGGLPGIAQAQPIVDISIEPPAQTVDVNEIFEVEIWVDASIQEVDTVQAYVNFDPTCILVVDENDNVIPGPAPNVIIPGPITTTHLTTRLENHVDNIIGNADIAYGMPPGGTPVNADFLFGTVRFKAMAETTGTALVFNLFGLRETMAIRSFTPVTGFIFDGMVTIEITPPTVVTHAATDLTQTSATLRGTLDSLGSYDSADVSFMWGTESGALDQETDPPVNLDTEADFSYPLNGLSSGTTSKAVADGVTVYGGEEAFTTLTSSYYEIAYDDGSGEDIGYLYKAEAQLAVLFTPPSYPVTLTTARIHLGLTNQPDNDHEQFEMRVYKNDGPDGAPGTLLGSVPTTATTWGWWDVDISGLGITIDSGSFYVAYFQLTAQPDCEATSADKTQPYAGRSWRKYGPTNAWEQDSYVNRMIRCVVKQVLLPTVTMKLP